MRVLGIDCGTERTGYGIIETDGRRHALVAEGTIVTNPKQPMQQRLLVIARELRALIERHAPEAAAAEDVFLASNVKTALKLAQVRGVVLLIAAEADLNLGEYSPLEIKTSVVGYGRAEKQQVQMMVKSLLHVDREIQSQDAADALAVAICHATRSLAAVAR
ncbi:MAG TPA: crossover junction endodeoxyribonuclease RuvC [Bryobacteraceae bacterium]|nr:crossover junction endodeoxyribonuclease RuvC [Bryobacteraceae bacterium]